MSKLQKIIFRTLKDITPPVIFKLFYKEKISPYGFFGDYESWEEIKSLTTGYGKDEILEKVKNAILKVKKGEALYERDSATFDKIYYSWPLLACLQKIAIDNDLSLRILDFGGSLGSHYFQNKDFLNNLNELKWGIVEQEHFVDCGKEHLENDSLKFFYDLDAGIKCITPNVIMFSNMMQYLEKPYEKTEEIINKNIEYILIDGTAFNIENRDRLTLQKVPPELYDASYPAWFLDESKFLKLFKNKYDLIVDFNSSVGGANIPSKFKGYLFKRKASNA